MWAFISVMCFLGSLACLLAAVIALFQKKGLHTRNYRPLFLRTNIDPEQLLLDSITITEGQFAIAN
jgi:hypothetical protein